MKYYIVRGRKAAGKWRVLTKAATLVEAEKQVVELQQDDGVHIGKLSRVTLQIVEVNTLGKIEVSMYWR